MATGNITPMTFDLIKEAMGKSDVSPSTIHITQNLAIARVTASPVASQFKGNLLRIDEYRIVAFKKGWAVTELNLVGRRISAGDLVVALPGSIIQIIDISSDIEILALAVTDSLFRTALGINIPKSFNGEVRDMHFRPSDNELMTLEKIAETLREMVSANYSPQACYSMIASLLWSVDTISSRQLINANNVSHDRMVFNRFLKLVNTHCATHHSVGFYADTLCLSPRYLGTLVKQTSGATAKEWIDRALIASAKVMLRHSDKQIVEIAYGLNFPNPAFFCKFFKRLTGTTPLMYRENVTPEF